MRVTCARWGMVVVAGLALATAPAAAQKKSAGNTVGIGVRAGTLGAGAELSVKVAPVVGLRAVGHWANASVDRTVDNIAYTVTPDFLNVGGLLDLHPMGGGFRLSAGAFYNQNKWKLAAVSTTGLTIGNTTYTPAQVGRLDGDVRFAELSPYGGIGYDGTFGGGRIGFVFDLGLMAQGSPKVALTPTTSLTGPARDQLLANVNTEVQQFVNDIDVFPVKYWPVLTIGLKFGL
ncbi:MAG: hypothetical protein NW201_12780 [Gemmatimonadales bacterium]|nr:hypothetical protein [Gemmatimonadales bacterium]